MQKRLILDFEPTPQKRFRYCKFGTYDPSKKDKEILRELILEEWKELPVTGPVFLNVRFLIPVAKSTSQRARVAMVGQPHQKKKDIDNLLKFLLDSMNGVVFLDDKQVWRVQMEKIYSEQGRIFVEVCY